MGLIVFQTFRQRVLIRRRDRRRRPGDGGRSSGGSELIVGEYIGCRAEE